MNKWVNDHLLRTPCVLICSNYVGSIILGYLPNSPRRWELLVFQRGNRPREVKQLLKSTQHVSTDAGSSPCLGGCQALLLSRVRPWSGSFLVFASASSSQLDSLAWELFSILISLWQGPILPLPFTLLKAWGPVTEPCLGVGPSWLSSFPVHLPSL